MALLKFPQVFHKYDLITDALIASVTPDSIVEFSFTRKENITNLQEFIKKARNLLGK